MAIMKVDTEAIDSSAQAVLATSERVRAEVQALRNNLEALRGSWEGQASNSFQILAGDWARTQAQVETSLAQIGAALRSAGSAYGAIETDNARRFAG
ncbi:WXG100 family type VII secretion target [Sinomonas atrocyanea]|uniref:WXG100 family type VII secretion target n=1 Tax=Sinomonas atrocyanea TaxID=37927 RepID=UPI003D9567A0